MKLVRYESAGHVATITMDRASAHNALNNALCDELREDLKEGVKAFAEKPNSRAGSGRSRPASGDRASIRRLKK